MTTTFTLNDNNTVYNTSEQSVTGEVRPEYYYAPDPHIADIPLDLSDIFLKFLPSLVNRRYIVM